MRQALAILVAVAAMATGAAAQPQPMSSDEIKKLISGKNAEIGADGIATYKADGKYEYLSRVNGNTSRGKWSVQGDSVCVDFDAGGRRCDQILKDGAKVILKNNRGGTFPITLR